VQSGFPVCHIGGDDTGAGGTNEDGGWSGPSWAEQLDVAARLADDREAERWKEPQGQLASGIDRSFNRYTQRPRRGGGYVRGKYCQLPADQLDMQLGLLDKEEFL
jgi:hypothetical protein